MISKVLVTMVMLFGVIGIWGALNDNEKATLIGTVPLMAIGIILVVISYVEIMLR